MVDLSDGYVGSSCVIKAKNNDLITMGVMHRIGKNFIDIGSSRNELPSIPYNLLVKIEIYNTQIGFKVLIGRVYLSSPKLARVIDLNEATNDERREYFRISTRDTGVIYNCMRGDDILDMEEESTDYNGLKVHLVDISLGGLMFRSREDKDQLKSLLKDYVNQFSSPEYRENRSRIMDTLAEIIRKQDRETPMNSLNGEKIEKIITSLLSSPCNYTPLLHFVIPVEYQGMKAFSELWIDPKDEGGSGQERDGEDHVHVLITFDIPGIGQMEAEFQVAGREMEFYLYCPESYAAVFGRLTPDFRKIMEEYGYHAAEVEVSGLDHVRSLMDVFKNLPYRRTGVDVKI